MCDALLSADEALTSQPPCDVHRTSLDRCLDAGAAFSREDRRPIALHSPFSLWLPQGERLFAAESGAHVDIVDVAPGRALRLQKRRCSVDLHRVSQSLLVAALTLVAASPSQTALAARRDGALSADSSSFLAAGRGSLQDFVTCLEHVNMGGPPRPQAATDAACPAGELHQVVFIKKHAQLSRQDAEIFKRLRRLLHQSPYRNLHIRVTGHAACSETSAADPVGLNLSLARARAVRHVLTGGLAGHRVSAEGHGVFAPPEIARARPLASPGAPQAICTDRDPLEQGRIELAISSPIALAYGSPAAEQARSALGGSDALPVENDPPELAARSTPAGATPGAVNVVSPSAVRAAPGPRYFPVGLHPNRFETLRLSDQAEAFRPSAVPQPGCAGFRSPWFNLGPSASLDLNAGRLYARLRTIVVRSDERRVGHGHGRDRIMVLLDLSGSNPTDWTDSQPAYPGGWASRLRLPLLLHEALSRATSSMGSRYPDAKLPAGCNLADAPRDAGIPFPESGFTDALFSLSASPEEVLMRALDFNPVRGVVRLAPGMRLCVTATGAPMGFDLDNKIYARMTFGAPNCQVIRRFTFASGREGLVVGPATPSLFRADSPSHLPKVEGKLSDAVGVTVNRWSDLIDYTRSSEAYLVQPEKDLTSTVSEWVNGSTGGAFVVGVGGVPTRKGAGLVFADAFVSLGGRANACRTKTDVAVVQPTESYWRLPEADRTAFLDALPYSSRCATAERLSDLTAEMPLKRAGVAAWTPVGTTWGELASEHSITDDRLLEAARHSRAASALFGARTADLSFSLEAARALPLLPEDDAKW